MNDKPEGYPFVHLKLSDGGYYAALVDWHPNGYEQISDHTGPYDDRDEAKHEAVRWAKELNVPYKVVIHG